MKKKLIILSDIYGSINWSWINYYVEGLKNDFQIHLYDSCILAGIDTRSTLKERHRQFIDSGILKATEQLIRLPVSEESLIIGFSIGGTIAWKAANMGLKHQGLFLVSATRLRFETLKPHGSIQLYYGEEDPHKPDPDWFEKLTLNPHLFPGAKHEFYRSKSTADLLIKELLKSKKHLKD